MNIRRIHTAFTILAGMALVSAVVLFVLSYFRPVVTHNFALSADVESVDNLYDPVAGDFSGEIRSSTRFYYQVVKDIDHKTLCVVNVFRVTTPTGDLIFQADRLYEVDYTTSKLLNRDGYLFAPRNLKAGEGFTYWHVNYNTPTHMEYVGAVTVDGVPLRHYVAHFTTDQTEDLTGTIAGVGETRGVTLDVELNLIVHPKTGRLIDYTDYSVASFYDLETGEIIHPWNKFSNTITDVSSRFLLSEAVDAQQKVLMDKYTMPVLLLLLSVLLWQFGRILKNGLTIKV